MWIEEELNTFSEEDDYEQKFQKASFYWILEVLVGSVLMVLVVITLAIYLLRLKRYQRFEVSILAFMLVEYCSFAIGIILMLVKKQNFLWPL